MKRLLIVTLLLAVCISSAFADQYTVTTETDPLRVHSSPQGDVIGQVPKGSTVDVISINSIGWATVNLNGDIVYMYAGDGYLTPSNGSVSPNYNYQSQAVSRRVSYTDKNLPVYVVSSTVQTEICARIGHSGESKILQRFKPGEELLVVCPVDKEWTKILLEDHTVAYVRTKYIEFKSMPLPEEGTLATIKCNTAKSVVLFDIPGQAESFVTRVAVGSPVKVIDNLQNGWSKVYYSLDDYGYVETKYLK